MVRLEEPPCFLCRPGVKAHLGDVAPCRKFDGCPNSEVEFSLIVFEVAACPKFVGLVDTKAEGNVNRTMGVSGDGAFNVNRKWRRKPPAVDLVESLLP